VKELEEMIEFTYSHHTIKYTLSRELMNVRAQEKLMFQVRQLDRAESLKRQGDEMEVAERQKIEASTLQARIEKEEARLRIVHQAQLKSLMKRI
jgi:hypothetical protein